MKLTRRQLRRIIVEERRLILKEEKKRQTEMGQLAGSRSGKKLVSAGKKILGAAHQIKAVSDDQTGTARDALYRMAEFVGKTGAALQEITTLSEGDASLSMALPTVQELKILQKELLKLEK